MMDGIVDTETGEILSRPHPTMPPQIAAAIVKVMGGVKQLGFDERNEHGKYSYASIDKFLAAMRPLLAAAGIFIMLDEVDVEVRPVTGTDQQGREKLTSYLFITYAVSVLHSSGVIWGPLHRRCYLPATGPQAFGSAESYVLKRFMRNLFQIPTGEKDADELPEGEIPARGAVAETRSDAGKAAWDLLGQKIRAADNLAALYLLDPKLIDGQRVPAWDTLKAAKLGSWNQRVALWDDRLAELRAMTVHAMPDEPPPYPP
jgi:hypothetical protein